MTVQLAGGNGGDTPDDVNEGAIEGGDGGRMAGTVSITAGDVLAITVGQNGGNGSSGAGGFNGGAAVAPPTARARVAVGRPR